MPSRSVPAVPLHYPSSPYIEELASLSFDAMAQVDMGGKVMWANKTFMDLVSMVGRGHPQTGLRSLRDRFLCDPQRSVKLIYGVVELKDLESLPLHSATQMVGPQGHEIVLWVIHQSSLQSSHTAPPLKISSPLQVFPSVPGISVPSNCLLQTTLDYPSASAYPDPVTKVYGDPEMIEGASGTLGLSNPEVLLMWKKYGRKCLQMGDEGRTASRTYYKCYRGDCKARLRIDLFLDAPDKDPGIASTSGKHNHAVTLAS